MVADARVAYVAKPRSARLEPKFEGSPRWWRGRIVDALRTLPPGHAVGMAELRRGLANGRPAPSQSELQELIAALEQHGLVRLKRGRVALPD
jgi:A/G-specific adenine glycosylase